MKNPVSMSGTIAMNHPNLTIAMDFINNACSLLIAIECAAEQMDSDAIKDASNGVRYLASRAYEELEHMNSYEAKK